jgi:hypothetical protein
MRSLICPLLALVVCFSNPTRALGNDYLPEDCVGLAVKKPAPKRKAIEKCSDAYGAISNPSEKFVAGSLLAFGYYRIGDKTSAATVSKQALHEIEETSAKLDLNLRISRSLLAAVAVASTQDDSNLSANTQAISQLIDYTYGSNVAAHLAYNFATRSENKELELRAREALLNRQPSRNAALHHLAWLIGEDQDAKIESALKRTKSFRYDKRRRAGNFDYHDRIELEKLALLGLGDGSQLLQDLSESWIALTSAELVRKEAFAKEIGRILRMPKAERPSGQYASKPLLARLEREEGEDRRHFARLLALRVVGLQKLNRWDDAASALELAAQLGPDDEWVLAAKARQENQASSPGFFTSIPRFVKRAIQYTSFTTPFYRRSYDKPPKPLARKQLDAWLLRLAEGHVPPGEENAVVSIAVVQGQRVLVLRGGKRWSERRLEAVFVNAGCSLAKETGSTRVAINARSSKFFKKDSGIGKMLGAGLVAALGGEPDPIELGPDWRTNNSDGKDDNREKRLLYAVEMTKNSEEAGAMGLTEFGCPASIEPSKLVSTNSPR